MLKYQVIRAGFLAVVLMTSGAALPGAERDSTASTPAPAPPDSTRPWNPNPIPHHIIPLRDQDAARQDADQWACYDQACADTDWDPYLAWDELAAAGYAVPLDPADIADGLVGLATEGALTGEVAAELMDEPPLDAGEAAELGAAIAVAEALVRSGYLRLQDDPAARRAVNRFERDLRRWGRRYAACLRPRGYRVSGP